MNLTSKEVAYLVVAAVVVSVLLVATIRTSTQAIVKYSNYTDIIEANEIVAARKEVQRQQSMYKQVTSLTSFCVKEKGYEPNIDRLITCKRKALDALGFQQDFQRIYRIATLPLPESITYNPKKDVNLKGD